MKDGLTKIPFCPDEEVGEVETSPGSSAPELVTAPSNENTSDENNNAPPLKKKESSHSELHIDNQPLSISFV